MAPVYFSPGKGWWRDTAGPEAPPRGSCWAAGRGLSPKFCRRVTAGPPLPPLSAEPSRNSREPGAPASSEGRGEPPSAGAMLQPRQPLRTGSQSSTTDTASATPPLSRGDRTAGPGPSLQLRSGQGCPTGRGCIGKGGKGEKGALLDSAVTANNPCLHRASPGLKFSAETEFIAVIPGEGRALRLAAVAAKGTGGRERAGEETAGQCGTGALLGGFTSQQFDSNFPMQLLSFETSV